MPPRPGTNRSSGLSSIKSRRGCSLPMDRKSQTLAADARVLLRVGGSLRQPARRAATFRERLAAAERSPFGSGPAPLPSRRRSPAPGSRRAPILGAMHRIGAPTPWGRRPPARRERRGSTAEGRAFRGSKTLAEGRRPASGWAQRPADPCVRRQCRPGLGRLRRRRASGRATGLASGQCAHAAAFTPGAVQASTRIDRSPGKPRLAPPTTSFVLFSTIINIMAYNFIEVKPEQSVRCCFSVVEGDTSGSRLPYLAPGHGSSPLRSDRCHRQIALVTAMVSDPHESDTITATSPPAPS